MEDINGSLEISVVANDKNLKQEVDKAIKSLNNLGVSAKNVGDTLDDSFSDVTKTVVTCSGQMSSAIDGIGSAFTRLVGAGAAIGFVKQMFNVRSEMQNTEAMFKVFTGSAEKASEFMSKLQDYAYNNVFEFKDLAEQSAQLMAYGNSIDSVIPTINKLSEIAAGTNQPLERFVAIWNKVKSTDSLDGETIRSLGSAGINVRQVVADLESEAKGYQVLANEVDVTGLKFKDFENIINQVSTNGGIFEGMMEEKMKTLGDSYGLLQDNITNMFNEIGEKSEGILKSGMNVANYLVENYQDVARVLATLVGVYGAFKAANIASNIAMKNGTGIAVLDNTVRAIRAKMLRAEITSTTNVTKTIRSLQSAQLDEIKALEASVSQESLMNAVNAKRVENLDIILNATQKQKLAQLGLTKESEAYIPIAVSMLDKEQQISFERGEFSNNNQAYIETLKAIVSERENELATIDERIDKAQEEFDLAERLESQAQDELDSAKSKVEVMQDYYEQSLQNAEATDLQEKQEALETAQSELEAASKNLESAAEIKNSAEKNLNTLQTKKQTLAEETDTIATKTNAGAKSLLSSVTAKATKAIKALWATMKQNPIGWILALLGVLISVYQKVKSSAEESKKQSDEYFDAVSEGSKDALTEYEILRDEFSNLSGNKDIAKWIDENKGRFEDLGFVINDAADAQRIFREQTELATEALIKQASLDIYKEELSNAVATAAKIRNRIKDEDLKNKAEREKNSNKSFTTIDGNSPFASPGDNMAQTRKVINKAQDEYNRALKDLQQAKQEIDNVKNKMKDAQSEVEDMFKTLNDGETITKDNTNSDAKKEIELEDILGKTLQLQIQNVNKELTDLFGTLRDGELAGNPFLALQYQLDELYTQLGEHKKELARQEIKDETLLAETIKSIDNETADNKKNIADKIQQYNQKQIDDRQAQIDNQVKQEKELYAELLLNYGTFQQQKKDISDKYTEAIALAEKKDNKQLVGSLKKQMQKELGDRAGEYLQQMFSKAFSDEATMNDIKEAFAQIDELASKTTFDQTIAEKYGISKEDWDIIIAQAKKFKKELSQKVNIPIVNELKSIKESFAGGDITNAMDGIMKVADMAGGAVSYLAQTFRELADATGDVNLDKTATALEKVGTFMDNTGQGASVGASVGGGWGALIGAIIGSGIGVAKLFGESVQEQAEAQAKREQESVSAIEENTQTLLDTISAMNSLADTISSLDYGQFSTVIQDALNQLNSDIKAYDSETNWRNINNALQSVDFQKRQSLEREYVEWLKAMGYDISGYYDNNLTDTQATANMVNNLDYEHIQKLKELWRELSEFQRSGENDSLKLWNIQNKILLEKRNGLENEIAKYRLLGKDTSELENQLASLNLQIKTNIQTMVEGLLGIDLNGIIDNWIKIFEEFGDSSSMVFDKISSSVDDMVKNILKQQFLIKPLSRELQRIMEEADVDDDDKLTYDEVRGVADRIGAFKESAYDLWESYREALEQAGIDTEVAGTTLSSSIKGVSEETASIIAGQMNAIRVHQIEIQDILQNNIGDNVAIIARNSAYLAYLPQMNDRLGRVESAVNDTYRQRLGV